MLVFKKPTGIRFFPADNAKMSFNDPVDSANVI